MPRSLLCVPDTRRLTCLSAVPAAVAGVGAAVAAVGAAALLAGAPAAARMLVEQRADLPVAVAVPLGVDAETRGWVAVMALPNARVTLGFWMLSLSEVSPADGCFAADLVRTPARCGCCCAEAVGVVPPVLPLDRRVVYLGVLMFSLPVAALVGVAFGLAFFGPVVGCCSALLLVEAGLKAGRCHLLRVASFASINAGLMPCAATGNNSKSRPSMQVQRCCCRSCKHFQATTTV